MKRLVAIAALLLCAVGARAQGIPETVTVLGPTGGLKAGAKVTVCSFPATGGVPCTNTVSIFSDSALSVPLANPMTTDSFGTVNFFVAGPGNNVITYTVTGAGTASPQGPYNLPAFSSTAGNPCNTTPNAIQTNAGGVFSCASGITTPDGINLNTKGPAPLTDVVSFGARAINGPIQTTVNCTSGNHQVTVGTGSYINGEGVTLQGCGPSITMSTPGAPTVVPQYANGPTRDHLMVNSPTGASTYIYCIVAEDKGQGLTPCSSSTTITNGLASLGLQTATITSESLSNDVLTVNTSSGTFVGGMAVDVLSGVPRFAGLMRTNSGGSGTFTVTQYVSDSRVTPSVNSDVPNSTSATGTVNYYQANGLTWTAVTGARRYWICAERPGDVALHVIGQSDLSNAGTGWQGRFFEDWGATYMASQTFPYYITDAICTGGGQADSLTTTVSSGGGTTTPTLTAAPSNNTTGTKINHDDGPAFIAAALQAGNGTGCMYLSPATSVLNTYRIASYTTLINGICIKQGARVALDDTLELNNATWEGWNQGGTPQFATQQGAVILEQAANPVFHMVGSGSKIEGVTFQSTVNGATTIVTDNSSVTLRTVNCYHTSSSDYLSICVQYRGISGGTAVDIIDGYSSFSSGLAQTADLSWTPIIDAGPGQDGSGNGGFGSGAQVHIQDMYNSRRTISFFGLGGYLSLIHYYTQGPITPMVVYGSTSGGGTEALYFNDVLGDTTGVSLLADLGLNATVEFHGSVFTSIVNPIISGKRPLQLVIDGGFQSAGLASFGNRWSDICQVAQIVAGQYEGQNNPPVAVGQQVCTMQNLFAVEGNYPLIFPLSPPATPTLSGPNAGGSVPVGTFEYAVSATGFDGGDTIPSPIPSSTITTTPGNQTVTVNWVAVVGAKSYNIWRCNTAAASGCTVTVNNPVPFISGSNWIEVGIHQTGTSFSDTAATASNNTFAKQTATGISQIDPNEVVAPQFVSPESTAPTCVAGFDQVFGLASEHRLNFCNNAGSALVVAANPDTTLGDLAYGGTVSGGVAAETRLAGPTTPNGVAQTLTSTPSGGLATAPVWAPLGVPVNAQTGVSYTILATDRASYLSFSNAGAIAVTLPQAGTAGFANNFVFVACAIGAGTATITPTTSTISFSTGAAYTAAAASMALTTGQCAWVYSDNTNYFAIRR